MNINIKLDKNFTTVFNKLKQQYGQQLQKLNGFSDPYAILTGYETRTSSPVRILRGETGVSLNVEGLYPCGEGAGYAGGIMSAAVDGIRSALAVMEKYAPRG